MNDLEKYRAQVFEQEPARFAVGPEPDDRPTSSLMSGILRRWYVVLLTSVTMCAIGIPGIWLAIKPLYSVTAAIRVAPILPSILTGEADPGEIANYQSFMFTQAEMITSPRVVQRVADDLASKNLAFLRGEGASPVATLKQKLRRAKPNPEPASILRQAISNGVIKAAHVPRTELIQISTQSMNPDEAIQIVDAFIRNYMAVEVESAAGGQDDQLKLLESEKEFFQKKLQDYHERRQELAQEFGSAALTPRQEMMLQGVQILQSELIRLKAKRISLEAHVRVLETTEERSMTPEDLLRTRNEYITLDPTIQELTRKIVEMEENLIVAKQVLAPGNPTLRQKEELLNAFRSRLEEKREEVGKKFDEIAAEEAKKAGRERLRQAQAELEQTKAHEKHLAQALAEEDMKTIEVGRKQLNIEDLEFDEKYDQEMYDTICRRISELKMERKRPARISTYEAEISHIRDKRVKYSVALVFGSLACGMMLAFLRDKADKRLWTPDDITKRVSVRIIGTTTGSDTVRRSQLPGQIAGDYQTIRANLGLVNGEKIPKKLVITSPGTREGKTTLAVNLATSMSKSGKKVLLIDGDLRKPDVARLLYLPKGSKGLRDVLLGDEDEFERAVYSVPTTGPDVLPANSHNEASAYELIASPKTAKLINAIGQHYDHVIIDTPPILAFPDALVWAKMADGAILTTFAGRTTAPELEKARERLREANVEVLGTVLSNVRPDHSYCRYGYYYRAQNARSKGKSKRRRKMQLLLPVQNDKGNTDDSKS